MTVPKSKREANKKWDSANMTIVGCRVTKDKAAQFKAACIAAGTNPNAVLLACVNQFISDHGAIAAGAAGIQDIPPREYGSAAGGRVTPENNSEE